MANELNQVALTNAHSPTFTLEDGVANKFIAMIIDYFVCYTIFARMTPYKLKVEWPAPSSSHTQLS